MTKLSVAARIVPNGQMLGAQHGQAVGSDCTNAWPHGAEIVTCGATAHKLMSAQLPVSEVGECSGHMCEGPRAHAPHGSVNLWLG